MRGEGIESEERERERKRKGGRESGGVGGRR